MYTPLAIGEATGRSRSTLNTLTFGNMGIAVEVAPDPAPCAPIHAIITDAVKQQVFPGAVVLIAHQGKIVHWEAYGTTRYGGEDSVAVTRDTIYDLASLTKVFTATAALRLVDQGLLDLDTPAAAYLPGLRATGVTIRHLLTHTSGLSIRLSLLRDQHPTVIRELIYALDPVCLPGTRVSYVNVNSLLLGDIVARQTGESLDRVIEALILTPLGMRETYFCPAPCLHSRIAPTEYASWRGGIIQGSVHDESAYVLGGVTGHAGLFSTALDLWRFLQMWLDMGRFNGKTIIRAETVAQATRTQTDGLILADEALPFHCGWGWMREHPIIMANAPPDTYGHTGYTGPAIINVPSQQLSVVLLSNRTYPIRSPPIHHQVTRQLLEAALNAVRSE